uniref:Hes family bHLH transcription factor 3 n=1 Tax=Podarcis muralis TaxID=64176 RepID=A0A670J5I1_PODMU|nr:transcription factor HES-3 [Podarcis muralis]
MDPLKWKNDSGDKMPPPWCREGRGCRMGTDHRLQERRALNSFRKVSKPLMEKRRRARINLSLEQLKALLEKNYSHQIRKRKLEKADILELSVKYMKSLQPLAHQGVPLTKSADYQAGFRSCLQGVRQFLLRSEAASEASCSSSFQLLHQLARVLPMAAAGGVFSTTDSDPQAAPPKARLAALGSPGGPTTTTLRKARPLKSRGCEASFPAVGGRNQAGSDRGQSGQPLPERSQELWRPW